MAFYCGNCRGFEPKEEGSRKGECKFLRETVWDDDIAHDDDKDCIYFSGD